MAALDLPALRVPGVPGEAMVTKVDRAVLAVAQPERRVEDHRQPMEARDVVRGADMQELVEAQREAYVKPGHRNDERPGGEHAGERSGEHGIHCERVAERESQVAPGIGVVAPRCRSRRAALRMRGRSWRLAADAGGGRRVRLSGNVQRREARNARWLRHRKMGTGRCTPRARHPRPRSRHRQRRGSTARWLV